MQTRKGENTLEIVHALDFFTAVGFNEIEGYRRVSAIGNNPDLDVVTLPEDVWSGGGLYPWIPSARTLRVRSTSIEDAPGGSGASSCRHDILDANYNESSLIVALNGLNPVTFPSQALRYQFGLILTKGSNAPAVNASNVGTIYIEDNDAPNTVRAIIPAGQGLTTQSIWTVPAGYTLQVTSIVGSINRQAAGGQARYATIQPAIQSSSGIIRLTIPLAVTDQSTPYRHDGNPGIILSEKTDFSIRAVSTSADNMDLTAAWLGILSKN